MKVRKYNGKLQDFDKYKIIESIEAAAKDAKEKIKPYMTNRMANSIEEELLKANVNIISSNDISTLVENELMSSKFKNTAWNYITFHHDRQQERMLQTETMKQFTKKLNGNINEKANANCDERSFSGRMNEAATVFYKEDALSKMSKKHRDNHNKNMVYIHDLNSYSAGMHNCLSIPFDDLFSRTLYTKQTAIRPPRSINTASQLLAVIIQVQSLQQYGGVSATHLDWTLIPSVRYTFFKHLKDGHKYITKDSFRMPKDIEATSIDNYKEDPCYEYAFDMTKKDTHQGMEALIHNLNSLQSRSGQQLPFSSINYGTCTLTEGRMVIEAILDATLEGTGPLHETPIFPCGIWQWDENINGKPGTPNYDLYKKALYCTTKRFYPNYCKANWSNNVACIESDRKIKRNTIALLTPEEKNALIEWIKKNPIDSSKINLKVVKGEIEVSDEAQPWEINSTMGKRKLQLI